LNKSYWKKGEKMPVSKTKKTASFEVKGTTHEEKPFTKTVHAFSEQNAREKTMALFGSKNKIKRRNIRILEVKTLREA
jgi:ribosomal protein L20A (L18A)